MCNLVKNYIAYSNVITMQSIWRIFLSVLVAHSWLLPVNKPSKLILTLIISIKPIFMDLLSPNFHENGIVYYTLIYSACSSGFGFFHWLVCPLTSLTLSHEHKFTLFISLWQPIIQTSYRLLSTLLCIIKKKAPQTSAYMFSGGYTNSSFFLEIYPGMKLPSCVRLTFGQFLN